MDNELRFEMMDGTVKVWKSILLNKTPLYEFFNELLQLDRKDKRKSNEDKNANSEESKNVKQESINKNQDRQLQQNEFQNNIENSKLALSQIIAYNPIMRDSEKNKNKYLKMIESYLVKTKRLDHKYEAAMLAAYQKILMESQSDEKERDFSYYKYYILLDLIHILAYEFVNMDSSSKHTSTEQSSEGANLLGKSVEMLANSIAEMRTYGEGFIIADQSPGLLDRSVIRNTNTKIILRLPDLSDRELVGYAAGLNKEQIDELSKLRRGVAAVYQNDWVEPVLVQVNKCELNETTYDFSAALSGAKKSNIREQLINLLIQGRVREKLDYSILDIEKGLGTLALSTVNTEFVEEQIAEYKENNFLELWSNENFRWLSRRLTDILGVRTKVENCVLTATDDDELTNMLRRIVLQISPEASKAKIIALSQCFMKDMSTQQDESEIRQKLYIKWVNHIKERGVR